MDPKPVKPKNAILAGFMRFLRGGNDSETPAYAACGRGATAPLIGLYALRAKRLIEHRSWKPYQAQRRDRGGFHAKPRSREEDGEKVIDHELIEAHELGVGSCHLAEACQEKKGEEQ